MGVKFNPFTSKLDIVDSPSGEFSDIELALGTQSAPSLSFTGDPNTGIYSPGADQVAISTNGTGRLFIDASGNVGFGTAPSAPLDLYGVANSLCFRIDGGAGVSDRAFKISNSANSLIWDINSQGGSTNSGILTFSTNSSERMRLDSSGRLGLGTASPAAGIDVSSGAARAGRFIRTITSPSSDTYALEIDGSAQTGNLSSSGALKVTVNSGTAAVIDGNGRLGIGTTSPGVPLEVSADSSPQIKLSRPTGVDLRLNAYYASTDLASLTVVTNHPLAFHTNNTERARIDPSGRLLVGTSSSRSDFFNLENWTPQIQIEGTNDQSSAISFTCNKNNAECPVFIFAKTRGSAAGADGLVSSGDQLGLIGFMGNDGAQNVLGASINAIVDGTPGANDMPGRLVFSTTADGAASPTERMRINQQGSVRIGGTGDPGAIHIIDKPGVAIGTQVLTIQGSQESVRVYNASSFANPNGAAMVMWVRANNTTSRSINAAGTINASGADYAEYMTKAGNFVLAKGDVCGIDANGLLTNIYTNSVSFVVKSTNPSYVGGDTWGCGFDADSLELEAERQKVDRIAFAGQVPVNVTSAAPGQYIVPFVTEDGGITGIAKDEADLTLAEYMRAVGKVIAIEDDGRARIIVKVA